MMGDLLMPRRGRISPCSMTRVVETAFRTARGFRRSVRTDLVALMTAFVPNAGFLDLIEVDRLAGRVSRRRWTFRGGGLFSFVFELSTTCLRDLLFGCEFFSLVDLSEDAVAS